MPAGPPPPPPRRPESITMDYGLFTFYGGGGSAAEAADDATGKASEWLLTHQWRNADALPLYVVTSALSERGGWYSYVLTFYGPTGETPPPQTHESAWTGKTERLR